MLRILVQVLILDSTEARLEGANMSAWKLVMADDRADMSPRSGIVPELCCRLHGASLRMASEPDADAAVAELCVVLDLLREVGGLIAKDDDGVLAGPLPTSAW